MAEIQPNWNAYYKSGTGDAPIWQGNPGLDALNKQYAVQQQQQAANVKDFTSELAKLNFNGARDADIPELHQDYGKILNTFQKYRSENDPKKQAELNLQMRQMQNQFMYKAQQSRTENDLFHEDAKLAHNPNVDLDDSYWTDMKKRTQVSTFDPKYDDFKNKQYIVPKTDFVKDAQELAKSLVKTTTTTSQRYNKATGSMENVSETGQNIDHDKFVQGWIASHSNDPNKVKNAIRETGIQDPGQAVAAIGEKMYQVVSGGGKSSEKVTGAGMTMGNKEALQENAARLKQLYPTFGQEQNLTPIYRQKWVTDMLAGAPNSGEALKAKIDADPTYDKSSFDGKGFHIGTTKDDNGKITRIQLNVPAKITYDKDGNVVNKIPERSVIINTKDGNADIKLNEAVNEITGEKVDISALRTQGGKKHVPDYEHTQKAKDPKTGKVYTLGFKNGKWYNTETNQEYK